MTMTGRTLDELGDGLGSRSLVHFAENLPPSSATRRASSKEGSEEGAWEDPALLPQLVATLIDEVRSVQWMLASHWSGKRIKPPQPIDRPGARPDVKKIGSGAIPIVEFDDWWNGGVR